MNANSQIGRIAYRQEGDWWVAYYAMPDTMEGALELGRVQMAIVQDSSRKKQFMNMMQMFIAELVPVFTIAESVPAPEHERSGAS